MKKFFLISFFYCLFSLMFLQNVQAQDEVKYFNNKYLNKQVSKEKARFSQSKFKNPDGSVTMEVREIKSNKITASNTYKGEEPFGIWVIQTGEGQMSLNYDFNLNYTDTVCRDSIPNVRINDILQDEDSISYVAPKLATGDKTYNDFLVNNLIYPEKAVENNIQGRVYVMLTINKSGMVENIAIKKGANILLDKEAARVLRKLKFSNPPTLNGKPQSFCMVIPVSFVMR